MDTITKTKKCYFEEYNFKLLLGDSFKLLSKINTGSINMIFADPPYFLSGEGITCKSGKMESVEKKLNGMKK